MVRISRRTSLGLLLTAVYGTAQQVTSGESEWKAFLDWFAALSPESFHTGAELTGLYRDKLKRDGLSEPDIQQALAKIREKTGDPKFGQLFWNKHFERRDPQFRTDPNAFLVEVTGKLPPGRALDIGMGEGRNAIFLAHQGWDVTGFDYAEAGVTKARHRAEELRLKLNALLLDADKFDFGTKQWDLVCQLYAPGPDQIHDFFKRLAASLKTGGYVISEQPYATPKSLAEDWASWEPLGFELVRLEYRAEKSDWGQPSFGRILVRKT